VAAGERRKNNIMAWMAVAHNNDELCDKLVAFDVLQADDRITEAFRVTDRGHFVPEEDK
jgi:hypothetical protein